MMRLKLLTIASLCVACSVFLGPSQAADVEGAPDAAPAESSPASNTVAPSASSAPVATDSSQASKPPTVAASVSKEEAPWDYSPYRVLIWLVSDDPSVSVKSIEKPLRDFLDRDFAAIWRTDIAEAPLAVATAAKRNMSGMSYDIITAADPVLAVKRDHPEAVRIRIAKNVGEFVSKVYGTQGRIDEVKERAAEAGDASIDGVAERLEVVDGDAIAVRDLWADKETEALLLSRGIAKSLDEPEAKLVTPKLANLVGQAVKDFDKIFVVRVQRDQIPTEIAVVELDTLMRHFGPVATMTSEDDGTLPAAVGRTITRAFAPVIRIDNAGQKNAVGLLRAGGLILDEDSPAALKVDDVLQPMTRKNDRNGKPIIIGPLDWAFLLVTEFEGRNVKMDFYAGRAGGLQGRKNKRTFRTALKVRPFEDETVLRLHLQRDPNFPLIGYELYEKELKSTKMTFIGRTDWNGRLKIEQTEDPFRLLYVKNGGAVLARLPMVPGLHTLDVADLSGDDMRLQAEAYIRGVQNAIIDLVAIRELFKARIHLRLGKGEMEKADLLMQGLRDQPSNQNLAKEMGKRHDAFVKALARSANQRRKVDEMFSTTRELLSKHISPKLLRDLETDMITAKKNGGKLPPKASEETTEGEAEPVAKPAKKGGNAKGQPNAKAKPSAKAQQDAT
ncbi:MAG: hypothetical protein ACR2NZ_00140 [Rubripirellula sp.]